MFMFTSNLTADQPQQNLPSQLKAFGISPEGFWITADFLYKI